MAKRKGNNKSFLLVIIALLTCFVAVAGITYLSTHSFSEIVSSVSSQTTEKTDEGSDEEEPGFEYVRAPKDVYL